MTHNGEIAGFFRHEPEVLPLFEALAGAIRERHPGAVIRVQRSQISFRGPRPYCAAWLPIRPGITGRPDHYLVVSFGLDREIASPRLVDTVESYPGRWTHHTIIADMSDIDDELMSWIDLAFAWKNGTAPGSGGTR